MVALMRRLPPENMPLTTKRRKELIDAFTVMLALIYSETNGEDQ